MRIKNKSFSATVIPLGGGKSLSLPARGSAELTAAQSEDPEIQRLFKERAIIVLPEGSRKQGTKPARGSADEEDESARGLDRKGRGPHR